MSFGFFRSLWEVVSDRVRDALGWSEPVCTLEEALAESRRKFPDPVADAEHELYMRGILGQRKHDA